MYKAFSIDFYNWQNQPFSLPLNIANDRTSWDFPVSNVFFILAYKRENLNLISFTNISFFSYYLIHFCPSNQTMSSGFNSLRQLIVPGAHIQFLEGYSTVVEPKIFMINETQICYILIFYLYPFRLEILRNHKMFISLSFDSLKCTYLRFQKIAIVFLGWTHLKLRD